MWDHVSGTGPQLPAQMWDHSFVMGPQVQVWMQDRSSDTGPRLCVWIQDNAWDPISQPSPKPNQTTEPNASRSASQELHGDRQRVARAELESLVTWTRTHCGAGCSPHKGFRGAGRARGAVTACRSGSVAGARCRCRILWVIKSPPAPRGEIAALGDSDKAAGEIPSEMQKRCAGRRCR